MPPATAERVGYTAPHPSDTAATAPHLDGSSALHKTGIREYRAGRVAEAVASLTEALKLAPMHAAGWSDLGAVHAASGRFDEAIACYD
jgi:Flp pilus assembly protein TadD